VFCPEGLSPDDLRRIENPKKKLNDEVMNCIIDKLNQNDRNVFCTSTYWRASRKLYKLAFERVFREKGKILFFENQGGVHWLLVVVDFENQQRFVLDSMFEEFTCHDELLQNVTDKLEEVLERKVALADIDILCPQQKDGSWKIVSEFQSFNKVPKFRENSIQSFELTN
jgi:hypothetical protein